MTPGRWRCRRPAARGIARTRSLLPLAVLLTVLVAACDAGRLPARPATGAAPTSTTDRGAAAAAQAELRLALKVHRLHVAVHPPEATLRIQTAGGAVRTTRTPFTGRLRGGHLVLRLTGPGRNTLTQRVLLDRDRSLELWMDPKGLLHHQVGELATGPNPKQVAFSPDGRELWVSLLGGHGVQVFDTRTQRLLDQIRLGEHGAVEVLFTADGRTVFASQMETASVFEIDRRTRKVRRQLFTKGTWSKVMALSPDERTLYVANWVSNDVSEIDLASGKVRRLLPTVRTPRGLYPTADGGRLFVAGYADGEIQRIDLRTGASKVLLRTGGAMRHLVGDSRRRRLYADDMALGRAFVVDLASERVRQLAATDKMPNTIDLSPDGRVLYVSNRGKNGACYCAPGPEWGSVLAIDTISGRILDAIVGGNQTTGLDVSPDGRTLAFSDFLDNRIHLYAIPSYQTLARGGGGRAIAHRQDLPKR
jgi:YVTN family beta-propeller protein